MVARYDGIFTADRYLIGIDQGNPVAMIAQGSMTGNGCAYIVPFDPDAVGTFQENACPEISAHQVAAGGPARIGWSASVPDLQRRAEWPISDVNACSFVSAFGSTIGRADEIPAHV